MLRLAQTLFCIIAVTPSVAGQTTSAPAATPFLHGIAVRINGRSPLRFGIDTGAAADFFISQGKAQQLRLAVVGHRTIHTSDKQVPKAGDEADIVRAMTLVVAGHTFTAPEGLVVADSSHAADASHDGTLGITLFRDVLLTLDYPHDCLSVSDEVLPVPNDRDVVPYTTIPNAAFRPLRVSPTVTIELAGHKVSALMDTGARGLSADVVVPTDVAATLPLGPTESETVLEDSGGRRYPSHTAKLVGDLSFGSVVLHAPTVLVSDWLGFVDLARICNRLVLTIDQRNHRLRITMPSSP